MEANCPRRSCAPGKDRYHARVYLRKRKRAFAPCPSQRDGGAEGLARQATEGVMTCATPGDPPTCPWP